MARLIRKQTYLTPEQDLTLKRLAANRHMSEAELLRSALEEYLGRQGAAWRDPFIDIIGMARGGPADGAVAHDRDIYDRV